MRNIMRNGKFKGFALAVAALPVGGALAAFANHFANALDARAAIPIVGGRDRTGGGIAATLRWAAEMLASQKWDVMRGRLSIGHSRFTVPSVRTLRTAPS